MDLRSSILWVMNFQVHFYIISNVCFTSAIQNWNLKWIGVDYSAKFSFLTKNDYKMPLQLILCVSQYKVVWGCLVQALVHVCDFSLRSGFLIISFLVNIDCKIAVKIILCASQRVIVQI
jgi:hypothetical protein